MTNIKIIYAQEHRTNSQKTSASYFYVRTHLIPEFGWSGEWHLPERATFTVYRSEYHHYPISIEFWICAVGEEFEENRISIYPLGNVASVEGRFQVIAESNSKTYVPRLMQWWDRGDGSIEYARLCARYFQSRIKEIPAEELVNLNLQP